jgi:hypothetical protein
VITSTTVDTTPPAPPSEAIQPVASPEPTPTPPPAARPSRAQTASARRGSTSSGAAAQTNRTTGAVDLDSKPRGARVSVDGKSFGTTPVRVGSLTPGNHQVRFELAGHKSLTSTVNIVGGEVARLGVSLERTTLPRLKERSRKER